MKWKISMGALAAVVLQTVATAAEVSHGAWSGDTKIVEMGSYWSHTRFKIELDHSCGNQGDGWWLLDSTDSDAGVQETLNRKYAALLSAYNAAKTVNFRCENSRISDFLIKN